MTTDVIDTDEKRKAAYERALQSYADTTYEMNRKRVSIVKLGRIGKKSGVYIEVR